MHKKAEVMSFLQVTCLISDRTGSSRVSAWAPDRLLVNAPSPLPKILRPFPLVNEWMWHLFHLFSFFHIYKYLPLLGEKIMYVHTGTHTLMFTATCSILITRKWKQSNCPSVDEWINFFLMWHIHAMEYYSAIKRNEVLAHATTRMNLENVTLSINRRSQAQNNSRYMKCLEESNL